jgi:hypothetical protein
VPVERLIRFHSGRSTFYALATSGAHPGHSDPSYGREPISLRWNRARDRLGLFTGSTGHLRRDRRGRTDGVLH